MPITSDQLIANIGELPALPQVATQVMRLVADPDAKTDEVQRTILKDQALTAQILKISNSAIFGMMREVKTLTQAIMTLGLSTIKCVAIASSTKSIYARGFSDPAHRQIMWEHSMTTAVASGAYARLTRFPLREEAFLAGLLHDVGKSILSIKYPKEYATLLRKAKDDDIDCFILEREAFGFDHAEVGSALMSHWNLPESFADIIRYHHDPAALPHPDHQRLLAYVALGNAFAHDRSVAIGGRESVLAAELQAQTILKLGAADLDDLREEVGEIVTADSTLMNVF
jgi:putative nucleotidyltransferase with HDIG domain